MAATRLAVTSPALTGVAECLPTVPATEDRLMSKGMDKKREDKKKPQHTKDEKRALKREKKRQKGLM